MKKILLLFSLFIVLHFSSHAQPFTFGPMANAMYSWCSTNADSVDSKGIFAYSFGGYARIKFLKFYLQPEVLYTRSRGGDFHYSGIGPQSDNTNKVRFKCIDANMMLGFQLFQVDQDEVGMRLHTGPGICFILDKSFMVNGKEVPNNDYKAYIYTWQFGAGADITRRLMFDIRYELGLNNMLTAAGQRMSTRAVMIQVAYKIIHKHSWH